MIRLLFNDVPQRPEGGTEIEQSLSPGLRSTRPASRQSEAMQIAEQSPSNRCGQWFGPGMADTWHPRLNNLREADFLGLWASTSAERALGVKVADSPSIQSARHQSKRLYWSG
jgi:hypothetical protein